MDQTQYNNQARQAMAAYKAGRVDEAVELFRQLTQVDGEDGRVWFYLGRIFGERQDGKQNIQQALRFYQYAAQAARPHPEAAARIAWTQRQLGMGGAPPQQRDDQATPPPATGSGSNQTIAIGVITAVVFFIILVLVRPPEPAHFIGLAWGLPGVVAMVWLFVRAEILGPLVLENLALFFTCNPMMWVLAVIFFALNVILPIWVCGGLMGPVAIVGAIFFPMLIIRAVSGYVELVKFFM